MNTGKILFCPNISRDHADIKIRSMLSLTSHFINKMITFQAVVFASQGRKLLLSEIWTSWTVNESSFHPSLLNKKKKKRARFSDHRAAQMTEDTFLFQQPWSDGIANGNHCMQIIWLQISLHCIARQWMVVTIRTVTSSWLLKGMGTLLSQVRMICRCFRSLTWIDMRSLKSSEEVREISKTGPFISKSMLLGHLASSE